ncbi:MAG: HAD-IB family hydrolase [Piscinibacter sp.]|uniref:HAD family hydrolase n=1 Tax=Piscinibacter TaxID=1114981 RepID=UPI000FDF3082|nr:MULTISPECIES: HAD-IB family hydrolase [Piscinibacter]MCW5664434.1 HAD-IB family hydrolase [Piscinibacter sp.]
MNLALFDLDHTLIPFDSGMAWTRFLIARGALPPEVETRYLDCCHQYVAGALDIHALHRAAVGPLAAFEPARLAAWRAEFGSAMQPRLPEATRALVRRHLAAGDLCALVTATSRLIAEPLARGFGLDQVLATEPELGADGRPTGAIAGLPCHREHKTRHVADWLARRGHPGLAAFTRSWFYSDSASDLPLLCAVTDPVAVRPDARLREHAQRHGWTVIDVE